MVELNNCDKCFIELNTYDLIWITSEDFKPRLKEFVPVELYGLYDCLCEQCYLKEITIKKVVVYNGV